MVRPSGGTFSGRTRQLRGKGRATVAETVRTFKVGDKIIIVPKAQLAGMPHLRFANRHGIVIEKRGRCYVVVVKDCKTTKKIVVGPLHLKLA